MDSAFRTHLYHIQKSIDAIERDCNAKSARNDKYSEINQFQYGIMISLSNIKKHIKEIEMNIIKTQSPIHTYVYLHEGAIHIKDMTLDEYNKQFDELHNLNRWSNIKMNYDMVTDSTNEIAKRAKLQVIDHRKDSS